MIPNKSYPAYRIVSDHCYGPLHFSRTDLSALTITRGREHGVPDYNTVRKKLNIQEVKTFEEINPQLSQENPEVRNTINRCLI